MGGAGLCLESGRLRGLVCGKVVGGSCWFVSDGGLGYCILPRIRRVCVSCECVCVCNNSSQERSEISRILRV